MRNILALCLITITIAASAQYNQAIGLRGGQRGAGITYSYHLSAKPFLNFDLVGVSSQEKQGGVLVATYNFRQEIHSSTLHTTKLSWSYGAGAHGGYFRDPDNTTTESSIVLGLDLRLSAEYQFKLPFVVGLDFTPYYNFSPALKADNPEGWLDDYIDFGVYLKYVID